MVMRRRRVAEACLVRGVSLFHPARALSHEQGDGPIQREAAACDLSLSLKL